MRDAGQEGGMITRWLPSIAIAAVLEAGNRTMQVKSFADGGMIEVQSVTASATACTLREGNVFGS
jgi:hypothetical protein